MYFSPNAARSTRSCRGQLSEFLSLPGPLATRTGVVAVADVEHGEAVNRPECSNPRAWPDLRERRCDLNVPQPPLSRKCTWVAGRVS